MQSCHYVGVPIVVDCLFHFLSSFLKPQTNSPPAVDMYLISEKSIWKDQVRQTGFLVYFKLKSYCLCSLQKINFGIDFCRLKIQFVKLDFSKYRSTGGLRSKRKVRLDIIMSIIIWKGQKVSQRYA